jgi:uncharacterized protein (TIGR02246 family)
VAAHATSRVDADRAEIMRVHRIWIRANETWEMSGLGESVAPDFVCFIGNGSVVRGRDAIVEEFALLAEGIDEVWKLDIDERELRIVGDAAWMTYEFHLVGTFDEEPFNERGRGTEVYERRDGRWLMAVGHWSWRQR